MVEQNNSKRVRELYLASGLSYSKLSDVTGIKRNTLANWIMGRRNPPDYVVEFIEKKITEYKNNIEGSEDHAVW